LDADNAAYGGEEHFLTARNDFLEILQSKISKKSFRAVIPPFSAAKLPY
jgi:hypothetical protein